MRRRLTATATVVLLAATLLIAVAAPAAACDCDEGEPSGDALDVHARVAAVLSERDAVQRVVIAVEESRTTAAVAGDEIVLRVETYDGACGVTEPLVENDRYWLQGFGSNGTYSLSLCSGGAVSLSTAAAPLADTTEADEDGARTAAIGMLTAAIAFAGLGLAYVRTRKKASHWDE